MEKTFNELVEIVLNEDSTTANTGMGNTGNQFSGDTYAPNDTRLPSVIGMSKRKFPELTILGTKNKKKHKSKVKKKHKGK